MSNIGSNTPCTSTGMGVHPVHVQVCMYTLYMYRYRCMSNEGTQHCWPKHNQIFMPIVPLTASTLETGTSFDLQIAIFYNVWLLFLRTIWLALNSIYSK